MSTKKQVKFFDTQNIHNLGDQVNEFLETISDSILLEIRYNQTTLNYEMENDMFRILYTAMVVYAAVPEGQGQQRTGPKVGLYKQNGDPLL